MHLAECGSQTDPSKSGPVDVSATIWSTSRNKTGDEQMLRLQPNFSQEP